MMMKNVLSSVFCAVVLMVVSSVKGMSFPAPSDTSGFKVMTYNIHHANPPSKEAEGTIDLQAIAKVINKAKPDLVALQEIDVHTERSGKELNEAQVLAELTGMHFHFTKTLDYQGGQYGIAILSRFPITDTFSYLLPVVKDTKEETRAVCMIKVRLPGLGEIYFASTHMGLSEATRILQVKKLAEIMKSLSLPLIIGGDFNATPGSRPIQILDRVFERSCISDCGFTIPAQDPRNKIDYIMFSPKGSFSVSKPEVIPEDYASDHLPYVVTFGHKVIE